MEPTVSPSPQPPASSLSLPRTIFHLSGIIIPVVYALTDKATAAIMTGSFLILVAALEFLRIKGFISLPFVSKQLKEKEGKGPSGTLFYLGACLITLLLFEQAVASAAICVLVFADPLSSIIGRTWGKIRILGNKSIEGTGAFLVASIVVIYCVGFGPTAVVCAALAATATELFSPKSIDDNFTIPLVTAIVLRVLGT